MIVRARAPLRLGLAGGGTDLSPFCDQHGGFVLNATISNYVYAVLESRDDGILHLEAADRQEVYEAPLSADPPDDGVLPLHKGVYRRILRDFRGGQPAGLNLITYSDVQAGSGLGSSSTLVVAMVEAFKEFFGLPLGEYEVAYLAYQVERIDMAMKGGRQDQYAAAFGGVNFIEFYAHDRVIVNPLRVKSRILNELQASVVLYDSGISRDTDTIIGEQISNAANRDQVALEAMMQLKREAVDMKEALLTGHIARIAEILDVGWINKKLTARMVTNPTLERVRECALAAGALAGKVSGAGGGGFMLFIVDPVRRSAVIRALEQEGGRVSTVSFVDQGVVAWKCR